MTRRVLTTTATATAIATAVGGCLLLGPTAQAQATPGQLCDAAKNCVTFGSNSISATSGTGTSAKTASVTFLSNGICAIAMANGITQKSSGCGP